MYAGGGGGGGLTSTQRTILTWVRESLSADRTYYVRTDGSDAHDGLTNSSGGAFLTIQHAANTVANTLLLNGYTVTIQIGDGTYTGALVLTPLLGSGTAIIKGNTSTPANVFVSTSANTFALSGAGANWTVQDLKVQSSAGSTFLVQNYAVLHYGNIIFGTAAVSHIFTNGPSTAWCDSNYSIVGSAGRHLHTDGSGQIYCFGRTITLTGTPAFSSAFANALTGGNMYLSGNTYSGSATGKRYDATIYGIIQSGTTLPGNVAGTSPTGTYI
jgi:hypothetical protein